MRLPSPALLALLCFFAALLPGDTPTLKPPTTTVAPKLFPAPKLPPLARGEPPHYRAIALPEAVEWKALNNSGLVVGGSNAAATWQNGQFHILPKIPHDRDYLTSADAVADDGTVAGSYHVEFPAGHAYHLIVWRNGETTRYIKEPEGNDQSTVVAMNNRHQLVCDASAFQWEYTQYVQYLLSGGKYYSLKELRAAAINDRGQIVGMPYRDEKIWLWQEGRARELGRGTPRHINNRGQIVGAQKVVTPPEPSFQYAPIPGSTGAMLTPESEKAVENWHRIDRNATSHRKPFLLTNGKMQILPFPGYTTGAEASYINNRGQIVGFGLLPTPNIYHEPIVALLWQNNRCLSLQNRTHGLSQWQLTQAIAINDRGEVLCQAKQGIQDSPDEKIGYFLLRPL